MITASGNRLGGTAMAGVVLVVLLAAGCTPLDSGAAVARGGQVFQDQGCYGCHTVGPTGTPIATDLTRIGARHDEAYFVRWLREPSQQKPRQHMPKLALSDGEVQALAAYLSALR
jgi:cytochrome c oxidase subunit 2